VVSVGCLCLVVLAEGNLAEARDRGGEVVSVVSGSRYGMREEGELWGAVSLAGARSRRG